MIWINDVLLPNQVEYALEEFDVMKKERTQTGKTSLDYIATKVRIKVKSAMLSKEESALIMSLLGNSKGFINVKYIGSSGEQKTGQFTSDTRSENLALLSSGLSPTWENMSAVLEEV